MRRLRKKLPLYWQRFCWALLGLAGCGAVIIVAWPAMSGTFLFMLYSMPANSLLPIPHEPGLLFFARYYDASWIALAGCVGTAVAASIDYPVVKLAFKQEKIKRARQTRIYRLAVHWLMRYPFATVFTFALTPLPIYVVRVLAPASGYPLWRYTLATTLGRYPRYYAIAWVGHQFQVPAWLLIALFAAMVAALLVGGKLNDNIGIDSLDMIEASEPSVDAASLGRAATKHRPAEANPGVHEIRMDDAT